MKLRVTSIVCLACLISFSTAALANVEITGEQKIWHAITLTFDGPQTNETAEPNPFTDYRLDVTFTSADGRTFVVPGYFAADGSAAETGAEAGDQWRVHFAADAVGTWKWEASMKSGKGVALVDRDKIAGQAVAPINGQTGTLEIGPTDKTGVDLRCQGRLQYMGVRYQRFTGSGQWFLKCGTDAPENLLAYEDFDATPNYGGRRKSWQAHARDYSKDADDLLWGPNKDKGTELLGAINYLSSKGLNAVSFLTFNVGGDDRNVFPHRLRESLQKYEQQAKQAKQWVPAVDPLRMDVSKLAQWDRIFSYADRKGMFLHFKTQETEVDHIMDGGDCGPERRLYYRELVARFGHHLALNWNFGEENTQSTERLRAMISYVAQLDPYSHLRVLHTYPNKKEAVYRPLLGDKSELTGLSLQTSNPAFTQVYDHVKQWVEESTQAGKPWVVSCDEPGDAQHSLITDKEDPTHDNPRINGLWGAFMAGGQGTEWYFGYKHPHSDLTCQDFRSRDLFWDQCKIALDFFYKNEIPFWTMAPKNELSTSGDWVFAGGRYAVVYLKSGGTTELNLPVGQYEYGWYNPRKGGDLEGKGTVTGGEKVRLDSPGEGDWVLLLVAKGS